MVDSSGLRIGYIHHNKISSVIDRIANNNRILHASNKTSRFFTRYVCMTLLCRAHTHWVTVTRNTIAFNIIRVVMRVRKMRNKYLRSRRLIKSSLDWQRAAAATVLHMGLLVNRIQSERMCPLALISSAHNLLYTRKIHNAEKENSSRRARELASLPKQVRHFLDATQATTLNLILSASDTTAACRSLKMETN
jgi:hypothetical protein